MLIYAERNALLILSFLTFFNVSSGKKICCGHGSWFKRKQGKVTPNRVAAIVTPKKGRRKSDSVFEVYCRATTNGTCCFEDCTHSMYGCK